MTGFLYSILPSDAGESRFQAVCYDPAGKGKIVWTSGKKERFGLGPFMIADNKMFILDNSGNLTMIKVSSEAYIKLASAKVLEDRDSWGPLVIVNGKLLLRDLKNLKCIDLRINASGKREL